MGVSSSAAVRRSDLERLHALPTVDRGMRAGAPPRVRGGDGDAIVQTTRMAPGVAYHLAGDMLVSCVVDTGFEVLTVTANGTVLLRLAGLAPYLTDASLELSAFWHAVPLHGGVPLTVKVEGDREIEMRSTMRPWARVGALCSVWKVLQCHCTGWQRLQGRCVRCFTTPVPGFLLMQPARGLLFALRGRRRPGDERGAIDSFLAGMTLTVRGSAWYFRADDLRSTEEVPFGVRDCLYLAVREKIDFTDPDEPFCIAFHMTEVMLEVECIIWCLHSNWLGACCGSPCVAFIMPDDGRP